MLALRPSRSSPALLSLFALRIASWLTGSETSDIEHIWQLSYRGGFYRGGPVLMSALSGIDIALWDLKGKPFLPGLSRPSLSGYLGC